MNFFNTLKLFLFLFLTPLMLFSYEVDNFTMRYSPLEPADEALDKLVNQAFGEVVEEANKQNVGCSKSDSDDKKTKDGHRLFRGILMNKVAPQGNDMGVFEKIAEGGGKFSNSFDKMKQNFGLTQKPKTPKIAKHEVPIENSIYGEGVSKKLILWAYEINSSIKLGNNYIGTDKLGHFFDQGYEYYKRWTLTSDMKDVFRMGARNENSQLGAKRTGVTSYADLAANYSGFLFWKNTTEGENPYFTCSAGVWKQNKDFHWRDHVTAAWDEAINCNKYESDEFQQAVEKNIKKLENKKKYTCPVDEEACQSLAKLWNAQRFLHPKCYELKNSMKEEQKQPQIFKGK